MNNAAARRFEMQACLGRGGYGEVYLATMISAAGLRQQVAVKTLREDLALRTDAVSRLRDEAKLLAALNHRAIVMVHDLVQLSGRVALICEYVDGQDLQGLIDQASPLPVRAVLEIISEVAGALDAAYNTPAPDNGAPMHLVHRDIKPANIRVSQRGAVKLLDFGIAVSPTVEREAHTNTGLVTGTPGFLAPERFTEETIEAPSDVYALGCVLFEALAGRRLFGGIDRRRTMAMALNREVHDDFVSEQLAALTCPPEVWALLGKMLDYDPHSRPTAAEVERLCEDVAGHQQGSPLRRWCRDRDWPPPTMTQGDLDGRTLSETTLISSGAIGRSAETFEIPIGPAPTRRSEPLPEPTGRRGGPLPMILVALAALVVGGYFAFRPGGPHGDPAGSGGATTTEPSAEAPPAEANPTEAPPPEAPPAEAPPVEASAPPPSEPSAGPTAAERAAAEQKALELAAAESARLAGGQKASSTSSTSSTSSEPKTTTTAPSTAKTTSEAPKEDTKAAASSTASDADRKYALCEAGDTKECTNLANAYYYGRGLPKDLNMAARLYAMGCDLGDGYGCLSAGDMYEKGETVRKDTRKALRLFEQGCQQGNAQCCARKGFLEIEGM